MLKKELLTKRLLIRRPRLSDAADMYASYASDPVVTKYLSWMPHKNIAETKRIIRVFRKEWGEQKYSYLICMRRSGRIIGSIALRLSGHDANFGYVLARAEWNKGYVTEALRAIVDYAVNDIGIHNITGMCDCENIGSARVMEKVGFKRKKVLKRALLFPNISDKKRDVYLYSLV